MIKWVSQSDYKCEILDIVSSKLLQEFRLSKEFLEMILRKLIVWDYLEYVEVTSKEDADHCGVPGHDNLELRGYPSEDHDKCWKPRC